MKSFDESNSQNAGKKRIPLDGSEALCKSSPFWILKRPTDLANYSEREDAHHDDIGVDGRVKKRKGEDSGPLFIQAN
jgi:hypothetical protein